jgi:hypothetical protein
MNLRSYNNVEKMLSRPRDLELYLHRTRDDPATQELLQAFKKFATESSFFLPPHPDFTQNRDLMRHFFGFFDDHALLVRMRLVCRDWKQVIEARGFSARNSSMVQRYPHLIHTVDLTEALYGIYEYHPLKDANLQNLRALHLKSYMKGSHVIIQSQESISSVSCHLYELPIGVKFPSLKKLKLTSHEFSFPYPLSYSENNLRLQQRLL